MMMPCRLCPRRRSEVRSEESLIPHTPSPFLATQCGSAIAEGDSLFEGMQEAMENRRLAEESHHLLATQFELVGRPPPPPSQSEDLSGIVLWVAVAFFGLLLCCCCFPACYRYSRSLCKTYGQEGWPATGVTELTPLTEPEESALGWVRWVPQPQPGGGGRWTGFAAASNRQSASAPAIAPAAEPASGQPFWNPSTWFQSSPVQTAPPEASRTSCNTVEQSAPVARV